MLTYTPKPVTAVPRTNEYPWLLLLLVLIWLWPGVFQHDLWKPGELGVIQAVDEMAANPRWLPTLYGEPYFGVSPVYIHTAAFFRRLLSPWLTDAYSAARFASVLFGSIGLFGAGMAGYRFLGRHHGRSVVLILIGCPLPISSARIRPLSPAWVWRCGAMRLRRARLCSARFGWHWARRWCRSRPVLRRHCCCCLQAACSLCSPLGARRVILPRIWARGA